MFPDSAALVSLYSSDHASYDGCFFPGPSWTAEQEEDVKLWIGQPNMARWLLYFMEDPQRISDYMAANCSTGTAGGASRTQRLQLGDFGFYLGHRLSFLLLCTDAPLLRKFLCQACIP
jgi:hypothetical protein